MCCTSLRRANVRQTKKRVLTLAFLICFIIVSLLSEALILKLADHEHDHNGVNGTCVTCTHVKNAENLLKKLATASLVAAYTIAVLFSAAVITHTF